MKVLRNYGILVFLGLIWGSSFILMKKGLEGFDPRQVAAMRLAIAGIFAWPLFFFVQRPKQLKDWFWLGLCGTLGNFFPAFMFTFAQEGNKMSSALAGAFNSLTPMFVLLLGLMVFGNKFESRKMLGVVIGLVGTLLLIFSRNIDSKIHYTTQSALLVITATLFYGLNANLIKSKLSHIHPLTVGVLPVCIVSIPSMIICLFLDVPSQVVNMENHIPFYSILILGLFGTAIALILFNYFIQSTSALFASMVTYLLPFVAALWGLADGEHIGMVHLASLLIIITGIYLTR